MPPRRPFRPEEGPKQDPVDEDHAAQDQANKETGGKVVEKYDYEEDPEAVVQATAEELLEANAPEQPSYAPVEVRLGPVRAAYTCPYNVKKPQHAIPWVLVASKSRPPGGADDV